MLRYWQPGCVWSPKSLFWSSQLEQSVHLEHSLPVPHQHHFVQLLQSVQLRSGLRRRVCSSVLIPLPSLVRLFQEVRLKLGILRISLVAGRSWQQQRRLLLPCQQSLATQLPTAPHAPSVVLPLLLFQRLLRLPFRSELCAAAPSVGAYE